MGYQAVMQEQTMRKGPWLEEEDERLTTFVTLLGDRRWDFVARVSGLRRSGKSCRLRWLNYLRPDLKHGPMSAEEEHTILQLHEKWGNKWSRIARRLPGRTDNEVKNYWRTHLRRKAQAQEQENLQREINNATIAQSEFLPQDRTLEFDEFVKEDLSDSWDDSVDSSMFSDATFASSPYEIRISNWVSEFTDDQTLPKHHGECNSWDSCFYCPAWTSANDNSIWDCSGSLWDDVLK